MQSDPFTIRIFVQDGDPDGIRIIDRMNWTGKGIVFPRSKWQSIKSRPELNDPGIYILDGYEGEDDDLPTVYIGQADWVGTRIGDHLRNKDFWNRATVFVSTSDGLNRAHITWLEYKLVEIADQIKRCRLNNKDGPQEPGLSEAEKADTSAFLKEVLQILPICLTVHTVSLYCSYRIGSSSSSNTKASTR